MKTGWGIHVGPWTRGRESRQHTATKREKEAGAL